MDTKKIQEAVNNELATSHVRENEVQENTQTDKPLLSEDLVNGNTYISNDVIVTGSDLSIILNDGDNDDRNVESFNINNKDIGLINLNSDTKKTGRDIIFSNVNSEELVCNDDLSTQTITDLNCVHTYEDTIHTLIKSNVQVNEFNSGGVLSEATDDIDRFTLERGEEVSDDNPSVIESSRSGEIVLEYSGYSSHVINKNIPGLDNGDAHKQIVDGFGVDILAKSIYPDAEAIAEPQNTQYRDTGIDPKFNIISTVENESYLDSVTGKIDYIISEDTDTMATGKTGEKCSDNIYDNVKINESNEPINEFSNDDTRIITENENGTDKISLDKLSEAMDTFPDNVFDEKNDASPIPRLSISEIMVIFPRLRTSSGHEVVLTDHEKVRSETHVNVKGPTRTLSTTSFDLLQTFITKGRFVTGVMSVDVKSLHGIEHNISQKQWCYILRNSDECKNKQWRYNVLVDKEPCQLNFTVIEDPTTVERWETSTFELMNRSSDKVQFESEWVLINCTNQDIELFNAHQNEVIELSCSVTSEEEVLDGSGRKTDKGCAVA